MSDIRRQASAVLNAYEEGYYSALLAYAELKCEPKTTESLKAIYVSMLEELGRNEEDIDYWVDYFFSAKPTVANLLDYVKNSHG